MVRDRHQKLEAKGVETELYLHRVWGHFAMFLFGGDAEDKAIKFLDFHNRQNPPITKSNAGTINITETTLTASSDQ